MSGFFSSRWVPLPPHTVEAQDGLLPKGFRAAGVVAGIKPSGARDVALIVSDEPALPRITQSRVGRNTNPKCGSKWVYELVSPLSTTGIAPVRPVGP